MKSPLTILKWMYIVLQTNPLWEPTHLSSMIWKTNQMSVKRNQNSNSPLSKANFDIVSIWILKHFLNYIFYWCNINMFILFKNWVKCIQTNIENCFALMAHLFHLVFKSQITASFPWSQNVFIYISIIHFMMSKY